MAEPDLTESDDADIEDAFGRRNVKDGVDEEEIDEEAVYDLSDSEESSSDEDDDEEEDEDDDDDEELDLDEEMERGGKAGRRELIV